MNDAEWLLTKDGGCSFCPNTENLPIRKLIIDREECGGKYKIGQRLILCNNCIVVFVKEIKAYEAKHSS